MEQVHVIRHKRYVEGWSVRRIARELGLHRKTVSKYLEKSEPRRDERRSRPEPVLQLVGARIETLLEEWEPRLEGKHRVTSPRVHRQLREEGYEIGERTVRRYLAERRRRSAEVYVPLVHRPGDEAQVDFFEVSVDEAGVRRKAWKFLMRLMYSGRDFVHLYDRCDSVSFLDGHVRAFEHFGGVPRRAVYDNLKAAVTRVVGLKERELNKRFEALVAHYLFEPCFARPRQGHDKGGVEGRGKGIRQRHLTPIVTGPDLESISAELLGEVEREWRERRGADGRTSVDLFEEERLKFLPPPAAPFEARRMESVSIGTGATAKVGAATYSVPEGWARLKAEAWVGPGDVRFICRGEEVVRPRQRPGGRRIEYRDYARELSRKPQAVRQVAPELTAELGEPYRRLWELLERTHGARQAARVLADVLGALVDHGEETVTSALEEALADGTFAADGAANLLSLRERLPEASRLEEVGVPPELRAIEVEAGRAADYDLLLVAGGEA